MQELLKNPRKYYLQFQTTIVKSGNRGNKFKIPGSIQVYEDAIFESYEYGLNNNISADNLYVPVKYSLDDKKSPFGLIQSQGIYIKYGYGTTVNKVETLLTHLTQKTKFNSFEVIHNRYKVKFDELSTPVIRVIIDELFNSPNKRINYSWAEPLQDLLIKRLLKPNNPKSRRGTRNKPQLKPNAGAIEVNPPSLRSTQIRSDTQIRSEWPIRRIEERISEVESIRSADLVGEIATILKEFDDF